jgi:poly(A) polymerase
MQLQFSCTIEPETLIGLRSAAPMLVDVSAERIRDEWFRILMQPKAVQALSTMRTVGLLRFVVPPVTELESVTLSGLDHTDALEHSFATVQQVERLVEELDRDRVDPPSTLPRSISALAPQLLSRYQSRVCDERTRLGLLKCAALLHELSRTPREESFAAGGQGLASPEQLGAEIAYQMGKRWRCSNAECDMLHAAVRWHRRPLKLSKVGPIGPREIHRYFRDTGEYGVDAAVLSLSHQLAALTAECPPEDGRHLPETVGELLSAYFLQRQAVVDPTPFLSGHDLMEAFGLTPGPKIGWLLAKLKEEQAAGEIRNRTEALSHVRSWIDGEKR